MNVTRGLWRGKIKDEFHNCCDGEWIKGNLIITQFSNGTTDYAIKPREYGGITTLSVDPETLGECIGRCDKNNNPIFEGDIVRTKYGRLCLVVWCSHSSFVGVDLDALEADHKAPSEYDLYDCLEIVGNCYDSPNLLTPNKT